MKLSDLAAQLIMIDIPGTHLEEAGHQHLAAHRWGGVLLFARNVSDRPQLLKLMDLLEDHDDVLNVYANFEISSEVLEALEA